MEMTELHMSSTKHPCEGSSKAAIDAFNAIAAGMEPKASAVILSLLVEHGLVDRNVRRVRFDPDALVGDALREGLRLPDQRRQTLLQVGGRDLVEAMVDLSGVDQVVALAPGDVEPVPLGAVEREAMVSVSRCAQVYLTRSLLRPVG
jgi:hypothetical protein